MSSPQEKYYTLAQLFDEASALLDANGVVVDANSKMFALFGRQIAGFPMERFVRTPAFREALHAAQSDKKISTLDYSRMEQTQRAFKLRLAPFDDDHVIMVVADNTDKLAVNRIRSDFVANVSHELRSPLTTLSGFIETLRDGAAEDANARTRFLDIMQTEAARMKRLIDDLLSLSRVEAEEHRSPDSSVNLVQVLQQTVSLLEARAAKKGIRLPIEIDTALGDEAIIIGDSDELQQVFMNLIENAIRYGDENQPVRLVVSHGRQMPDDTASKQLIRAQIINKGPMIAEEHIARLTERFYRIDKGRSREIGGTGLGLAIVKHIINKHRGRLRITSDAQATVFSVTLRSAT